MEPPGHLYRHSAVGSLVGVRSALRRMYAALARLQPLLFRSAPLPESEEYVYLLGKGSRPEFI